MTLEFNSAKEALEAMPITIEQGRSVAALVTWWDAAKEQIRILDYSIFQQADSFIERLRSTPYALLAGTDIRQSDLTPSAIRQKQADRQRTILHYSVVDNNLAMLKQQLLNRNNK